MAEIFGEDELQGWYLGTTADGPVGEVSSAP
jgi:hypothetical protein